MPDRANPALVINGSQINQYFHNDTDEYTEIKEAEL